jgi:hypothetical protein
MAYSRFFDSDIYIYPHVGGWIECQACYLNEPTDQYSLFSVSEEIHDDGHLITHVREHIKAGHNVPVGLLQEILDDPDRYGVPSDKPITDWCDDCVVVDSKCTICGLTHSC